MTVSSKRAARGTLEVTLPTARQINV